MTICRIRPITTRLAILNISEHISSVGASSEHRWPFLACPPKTFSSYNSNVHHKADAEIPVQSPINSRPGRSAWACTDAVYVAKTSSSTTRLRGARPSTRLEKGGDVGAACNLLHAHARAQPLSQEVGFPPMARDAQRPVVVQSALPAALRYSTNVVRLPELGEERTNKRTNNKNRDRDGERSSQVLTFSLPSSKSTFSETFK